MKKLLFIFGLLICQQGHAQLNLDSLWGVYNNDQKTDSVRLMAMWFIAYDYYMYTYPDSSFLYADQMYEFAKEKGELQYQGFALGTKGTACYYLGKMDLSIEYHKRALVIHKELKNLGSMGSAYNNIANVLREQGKLKDATDYFVQALDIYEKMENKQAISTVLGNLGAVADDMGDHANSKEWYAKALAIKKQTDDKIGLSLLYTGIGTRFLDEMDFDSAMYYQREGLRIRTEIGNTYGIGHSLAHIGEIYLVEGQFDSAMVYYDEGLIIFEELNLESGIADVCHSMAKIYEAKGNYAKAMKYAQRSLETANKGGYADSQRDVSYLLFKLYKRKGDFVSALQMHEDYVTMRDSIEQKANQKAIMEQQYQYTYDKKSIADSLKNEEIKKIADVRHKKETEKQQIVIGATAGGLLLVVGFLIFVFNRLRVTKKQKLKIEEQKVEVEEKNQEIMDSITYAKRIQSAILPPDKIVKEYLQESFILYKPKDIVAGDFYWMEHKDGKVLFAAADCTGHGVPGAMVSVVCNNALNRSVREHGLTEPGLILDKTRDIVIQEFEKSNEDVKDGMDIALCTLEGRNLQYSGANNPLWIVRDGEVLETKANKQPIGKFHSQDQFTTHSIELEDGDAIYIFSDGYVDQFGGEKGKKFKAKPFRELLLSIQKKSMEEQKLIIDQTFENWKGSLEQLDDVCVIGVKV